MTTTTTTTLTTTTAPHRTEQDTTDTTDTARTPDPKLRRRGLVAGAAALVAGLAVKAVIDAEPVAADGATWTQPYFGSFNTNSTLASFSNTGTGEGVEGSSNGNYGVYGNTNAGTGSGIPGVYGVGNGAGTYGVYGNGLSAGTGVYGETNSGTGVLGTSNGTGSAMAAQNAGTGYGLSVIANANYAVYAASTGAHTVFGNLFGSVAGTAGVFGDGNGAGTYGVYGINGGSGTAVYGSSTGGGIGVYGNSTGGSTAGAQPYGVVGTVSGAPGFALYGVTTVAGTVAFAGGTTVVGGIAGQLSGPVNIFNTGPGIPGNLYVQGNQTASGTKSAAVPHPDGSHRLLYCVESPEAWFEDFGEGTITGGKAEVKLDPDFAAVVDTAKLHVFITEHDAHHLHVPQRTATGFAVAVDADGLAARGIKAADVNSTFTYRVVAKRKDVQAPRLAKFAMPQEIKVPALVVPATTPRTAKAAPAPVVIPPMPPNSGKKG